MRKEAVPKRRRGINAGLPTCPLREIASHAAALPSQFLNDRLSPKRRRRSGAYGGSTVRDSHTVPFSPNMPRAQTHAA